MITVGLLLIVAALLLSGYNLWEGRQASMSAQKAMAALQRQREERTASDETEEVPFYKVCPEMEMPVIEIDGETYIGTLEIPSLGLELPVMNDWSYPKLKKAPCRYGGSAYQENLMLAGHNYPAHFGRLNELALGAEVRFTDVDGHVFVYEAADIEKLPGTAVEEMAAGGWALTLFTCTLDGRSRVVVRCE